MLDKTGYYANQAGNVATYSKKACAIHTTVGRERVDRCVTKQLNNSEKMSKMPMLVFQKNTRTTTSEGSSKLVKELETLETNSQVNVASAKKIGRFRERQSKARRSENYALLSLVVIN